MIGSGKSSNQNETNYGPRIVEGSVGVGGDDIITKQIAAGNGKVKEVQYVTVLQDSDVLFGRGSGPNDHEGNMKFRTYVMDRKKEYMETNHRLTKTKIARSIVDLVYNSNGRFLKRLETKEAQDAGLIPVNEEGETSTTAGSESVVASSESGIIYYEIQDDETCMEKAKQALRQNAAKFRNEAEMMSNNSSDAGGAVPGNTTPTSVSPFPNTINSINPSNVVPIGSSILFTSSDTPHNSFIVRGGADEIGSGVQSQHFHASNLNNNDDVYYYDPIPLPMNQNHQNHQQQYQKEQLGLLTSQITQQLPQQQQSQRVSYSNISSSIPYTNSVACALPTTAATPTSNILLNNSGIQQYHHQQQQSHHHYDQQRQLPNPQQEPRPQQQPTRQQQATQQSHFQQSGRMESISVNELMRDHSNLRRSSSSCANNNNTGMMDDLLDSLSVMMSSTDIHASGVDMVPIQQVQVQQQEEDENVGSNISRSKINHNRFISNSNNPSNNFLRNSLVDRRISNDTMGTIEELGSLANMSIGTIQDSIFSSYGDITDTGFMNNNNSNTMPYPTSVGGPQQQPPQYSSYQGRRTNSLRSSGRKSNISITSSAFSSFALTEMNEDDEDNDRSYLDDEAVVAASTNDIYNANSNTTANTSSNMNVNELDFFNQIKREFYNDYQRQQLQQQQDAQQDQQEEKRQQLS